LRNPSRLCAALGLVMLLSGCAGGILSGAGPYMGRIMDDPEERTIPYELVDLSPQTIAPYTRPVEGPIPITVSPTKAFEIRLVPGDVLQVLIADIGQENAVFAPLATGGTKFEARVDSKGKISLPYAGHFSVARKTPAEV